MTLVAELVQQNRELVSAQPAENVSLPQARLETARHRREQLVAHQVAEAVVDDLEAVEAQTKRREPAAVGPFFEVVEAAPQPSATGPGASAPDVDALITEASRALADYQRLTAEGKLGEAGQKLDQLKRALEALAKRKKS